MPLGRPWKIPVSNPVPIPGTLHGDFTMNRSSLTVRSLALALVLGASLPSLAPAADAKAANAGDTAWRQEVETFRKQRFENLKKEDGWFTLVGLFWLDEGENAFGSDPGSKVILPEG